jgi:thiol-disulfide isomerase/thioredoxin
MQELMKNITALLLGVGVCTSMATASETATNFEGIDLSDTTEDPAYAEAGEKLTKGAMDSYIGTPAPWAKMTTIDGQEIDLESIYGKKPVYLKFWATWCTPCRQQMPGFEETYKSFGDEMEIIAVNIGYSDDEASVRAFRDKFGLTMPIVIDDGQLAKRFHVNVTPQHVLIGTDVRFAYFGHAENETLEQALQHVFAKHADTNAASAMQVKSEQMIQLGDKIPDRSITVLSGESIPLKAQPGHLLAVEFFSAWGAWYLESSRPETSKASARVREEIEEISTTTPKVDWLGIAGGLWTTEQDLTDYKTNYAVTIPLHFDQSNDLFRLFDIQKIPTVALINSDGSLVRLIGPTETNLTEIIQTTLAETTAK